MSQNELVLIPLWYAVFLLSLTCHEAAHAFMAYRGGDATAYAGGQVTLNPLPHIQREPFGTIVIPLITFVWMGWMMGWASAPYDPLWEDRHPRRAAAMAAAGPAANAILALIALLALKAGLSAEVWVQPDPESFRFDRMVLPAVAESGAWEGLGRLLSVMFGLNLLLLIFNLIPVPPLDGSAVLAGLFAPARRLRDELRGSGFGGMIGLIVAWMLIGRIFSPLLGLFLRWLYT